MSKTILGLDLGTNSIGWALVEQEFENQGNKTINLKKVVYVIVNISR